jgi:hypothetical protein
VVVSFNQKYLQVLDPDNFGVMTQPGFDEQWPLAISPEGRLMSTESANGRIYMWDLFEVRRELATYDLDWDLEEYPKDTARVVRAGR